MKKKLLTCIAVTIALFSVSSLYAQRDTTGMAQRMVAMRQKMKDDLKLTDVQADSLTAIQQEFQPKVRDIFMDQSISREDKQAKIAPLNDARNARIKGVLGDDLYKKYQDWMEQNRPQRGGGGGGGRRGGGGGNN